MRTLPAFWLLLLAKAFDDACEGAPTAESCDKHTELVPPGACCSRVEDLSVRTLPAFWLLLLAKAFDEALRVCPPAASSGRPPKTGASAAAPVTTLP